MLKKLNWRNISSGQKNLSSWDIRIFIKDTVNTIFKSFKKNNTDNSSDDYSAHFSPFWNWNSAAKQQNIPATARQSSHVRVHPRSTSGSAIGACKVTCRRCPQRADLRLQLIQTQPPDGFTADGEEWSRVRVLHAAGAGGGPALIYICGRGPEPSVGPSGTKGDARTPNTHPWRAAHSTQPLKHRHY